MNVGLQGGKLFSTDLVLMGMEVSDEDGFLGLMDEGLCNGSMS